MAKEFKNNFGLSSYLRNNQNLLQTRSPAVIKMRFELETGVVSGPARVW